MAVILLTYQVVGGGENPWKKKGGENTQAVVEEGPNHHKVAAGEGFLGGMVHHKEREDEEELVEVKVDEGAAGVEGGWAEEMEAGWVAWERAWGALEMVDGGVT